MTTVMNKPKYNDIAQRPLSSTSKQLLKETIGLLNSANSKLIKISLRDYDTIRARIAIIPDTTQIDLLFYKYPYMLICGLADYLNQVEQLVPPATMTDPKTGGTK